VAIRLYDIKPIEPLLAQGLTLLTPNLRLARRIQDVWAADQVGAGRQVWEPLPVYPVEQWLHAKWLSAARAGLLPAGHVLKPVQELEIWRQIIEGPDQEFALLRTAAAAELASRARDTLLRWEVDVSATAVRQMFELDRDCDTFLAWLRLFERRISQHDLYTPADCLRALALGGAALPAAPAVALLECGDLPPLVRTCLEQLCPRVVAAPAPQRNAHAVVHPFPDQRAELQGAAAWAASLQQAHPGVSLGIVLAGGMPERVGLEYLLRREFGCLGENYNSLPVNFSTGISLSQAPLVRDALAVLALGLERVAVVAVAALFRSRFIAMPDAETALAQYFLRELFDGGSEQVTVVALRNFAGNVALGEQRGLVLGEKLLLQAAMRELRGRALPSDWVGRLQAVLGLWGWPGAGMLDSVEFQQLRQWSLMLEEFRGLDAVSGPLDYGQALGLLRSCCDRQISHPQTEDSPVQVLGALEAAGLQFDHLWICGMQGGNWPASPRPNPLLPVALQVAQHMPHASAEREWVFSEELVAQYRRSCGTLHASYSLQIDGVPALPSGLVENFVELALPIAPAVSGAWAAQQASARLETLVDDRAPALDAAGRAHLRGGAALLERQSHCPFAAFARHRLEALPLGEFVPGIAASERGSLVHNALYVLWGELQSLESLQALDVDARRQLVRQAVDQALQALPAHRRAAVGQACLELEHQRLCALMAEWLAVEEGRPPFRVQAREAACGLQLGGLDLTLRVDRIDTVADGARIIIDYKTGAAAVRDWLGDRPASPQLPLYALAADQLPGALAFARVRPAECSYVGAGAIDGIPGLNTDIPGLVRGGSGADDWPALLDGWREVLERLAADFTAGAATVDPLRGSCQYCGLQPLCRVDAGGLPAEESDLEDAG